MLEPGAAPRGEPTPVLVLDDEPDVRFLIGLALGSRGYRVLATEDGREALRLLRAETVPVALVDLLLPGMSGAEFLDAIEELPEPVRPEVLLVSALQPDAAAREIGGRRHFDFLGKPFELPELRARIERALEAWRARRSGGGGDPRPPGHS